MTTEAGGLATKTLECTDGVKVLYTADVDVFYVEPRLDRRVDYKDMDALKLSLTEKGMQDSIKVFYHPTDKVVGYENQPLLVIEDGMRRFRAAQELAAAGTPIQIKFEVTWSDPNATYAQLVDDRLGKLIAYNDGEKFTQMEEAAIYKEFLEDGTGKSMHDVARLVGKSTAHVSKLLPVNELSDEAKEVVASGAMSPSTAVQIANASETAEEASQTILEAAAAAVADPNAPENKVGTEHIPNADKIIDKKLSSIKFNTFKGYFEKDATLYGIVSTVYDYMMGTISADEATDIIKSMHDFEVTVPQAVIDKIEADRKKEEEGAVKLLKSARALIDKSGTPVNKAIEQFNKVSAKIADLIKNANEKGKDVINITNVKETLKRIQDIADGLGSVDVALQQLKNKHTALVADMAIAEDATQITEKEKEFSSMVTVELSKLPKLDEAANRAKGIADLLANYIKTAQAELKMSNDFGSDIAALGGHPKSASTGKKNK